MEKNIADYAEMISRGEIKYKDNTSHPLRCNVCALAGCALQLAAQDWAGNKLEFRFHGVDVIYTDADGERRFLEIKHNSSPIEPESTMRCSMIAYAPYVRMDKPLDKQVGYVLPLQDFLRIGKETGLLRTGTSRSGTKTEILKTQTVYNNKRGEYHGKLWFKVEERFIAAGAKTFREFFGGRG